MIGVGDCDTTNREAVNRAKTTPALADFKYRSTRIVLCLPLRTFATFALKIVCSSAGSGVFPGMAIRRQRIFLDSSTMQRLP